MRKLVNRSVEFDMVRVLVVDDQLEVQDVLTTMLTAGGHEVVQGRAGSDLWDALMETAFDVVITDLKMPALDGWAVGHWIRQHRPDVRVIALSGVLAERQATDGPNPFDAMLVKPVRRAQLLAAVSDVLARRPA